MLTDVMYASRTRMLLLQLLGVYYFETAVSVSTWYNTSSQCFFYSSHVPKEVCVLIKFHVAKAIFVRCIIVFRNCFCVCHTSKQFLLLKNWEKV